MSTARAFRFEQPDSGPKLDAPRGETPVAAPGFRRAMVLMVALSIPLWALIIGAGYALYRVLG